MKNVASYIAQTSGTEGQNVATTSLTLTTGLNGLSTTSAVLIVCSATITTATVPTMSHASSRAVSVITLAGPCGPIMTVVSTSSYVTGHTVKETVIEPKVDQAVEDKISKVVIERNRSADQLQEKLKTKEVIKIHAKLKSYAEGPGVKQ